MAVPLAPILKKSYWILVGLGAIYLAFLGLLTSPWVQRQALYAHRAQTAGWWHNLSEPEQFGFLNGQIQEARVSTPDGESLYGWHVLPVGAYSKHEKELSEASVPAESYVVSRAFELLIKDPEAKLIINFHGNAGHVGQGWRTDTYQTLTAVDNEHAHVFTFDYRGFGHSTGLPSEEGLIRDGVAVVESFLQYIAPSRIVLVGNSLGVAVSIATAEQLQRRRGVELGGLVLVAGFRDLPALMATYAIFHAIPVFSPLRPYPRIHKFFERRIIDTWDNAGRIYNYTKASQGTDITIIHARNDYDIPWSHSNELFYAAANGTSSEGMNFAELSSAKLHRGLKRGGFVNEWKAAGDKGKLKKIKQIVLRDGGHNRIMTFPTITKAVMEAFQ